jgi:large subunit ribosomal protein L28
MARRCRLTSKAVQSGNLVSHSNHKTRCRFLPNMQVATLRSEMLGESFRMRITTHALRSIEINGGFDSYLLSVPVAQLAPEAAKIKRRLARARAAKA